MFSKTKRLSKLSTQSASANRRKRRLANNKKKIIWRHKAYVHTLQAV